MSQELTKEAYQNKLRSFLHNEDFDKTAEAITPYVKRRLYEESFIDRVLAVRTVDQDELIPETETQDDSFYVIGNVEQHTEIAVKANFRDRPEEDYIFGDRYKIPIGMLKTRQFKKNVNELLVYDYDLLEDAQQKDVFELGNLRDWELLKVLYRCVDYTGRQHEDIVDEGREGPVQISKVHFNRLAAMLNTGGRTGKPSKNRLKAEKFLTSNQLVEDLALLDHETVGNPRVGDLFENGAMTVFNTVLGQDILTSIKERFFTEHEHVTIFQATEAVPAGGATFNYGEAFTLEETANAEETAQAMVDALNASDNNVRGELRGEDQVRIISTPQPDEEDRYFQGHDKGFDQGDVAGDILNKGWDRWDTVWVFPPPQFIGEVVRINGKGVRTEMWRQKGEDMVNRYSKEFFGMGIGNAEGAAVLRIQRKRLI